jgi:FlaA1/EpsC-like NDP-sugar epimerase
VHSIEAMCDTNVFMAKKLLDLLLENPPQHFFCVSTDKAANPINVMGATKKLMEETIMAYADRLPIKTARFANVAFSNGSLPIGWLNRIAKKQPLSCPMGIRRFFVSPVESGELCLAASVLAESGDIVYPKLDEDKDMIPFDRVVKDMLNYMGLGCKACSTSEEAKAAMIDFSRVGRVDSCSETGGFLTQRRRVAENAEVRQEAVLIGYPCEFFGSDTDGEKTFEEFYTATDEKDETTFVNLGVVKNAKRRPVEEVENIFAGLYRVFDREGATKEDVVEVLKEYLPNFSHISKGKSLDGRM